MLIIILFQSTVVKNIITQSFYCFPFVPSFLVLFVFDHSLSHFLSLISFLLSLTAIYMITHGQTQQDVHACASEFLNINIYCIAFLLLLHIQRSNKIEH